ncbi:hypothetical protein OC835_004325 [Tilletia horrida]|nr:hypothetical protein OC835_004325 [Tilletia horrida]KAK0562806.1 hypothetical protein OC844_002531 [Tilletia horrida]
MHKARHIDAGPSEADGAGRGGRATVAASSSRVQLGGPSVAGGKSAQASASAGLLNMTYQPSPAVLPTHLALSAHIQARSYQLESFQRALLSARTAANMRAWQLLPRHARRRAASHNLLRVPKRLRGKALAELKASNTLALTKAKIRKRYGDDLPLSRARKRTAILLLRAASKLAQSEKAGKPRSQLKSNTALTLARASKIAAHQSSHWLETHLWHAKRFHMSSRSRSHPMHGKEMPATQRAEADTHYPFALAYRPHMKGHRAAVRASLHQCTLRDVSWWSFVRVSVRIDAYSGSSSNAVETDAHPSSSFTQAQASAAILLEQAGARDGWQREWQTGTRMCYSTLVGCAPAPTHHKAGSGKGKARQLDDDTAGAMPRCHAHYPVNVLWLPTPSPAAAVQQSKPKKGKLSRHRKRIRERARAEQAAKDALQESATQSASSSSHPGAPTSSAASKPSMQQKLPAYDEDDMDALMNAQDDEEEDDMDAMMNGGYDDDDEDTNMEDGPADGNGPASSQARKKKRRYHRSKAAAMPKQARDVSKAAASSEAAAASYNKILKASSSPETLVGSTSAAQTDPNTVFVLLQTHPSCVAHLIDTLRRSASALASPFHGRLILEIQELNAAPSAGVAVGRGRAALAATGLQGNVRHLMRDEESKKKAKGKKAPSAMNGVDDARHRANLDEVSGGAALEGYNAFELIGPEAGRLLVGVLKPVPGTSQSKLDALKSLMEPNAHRTMPRGRLLALDVHDPRLSFPPKLPRKIADRDADADDRIEETDVDMVQPMSTSGTTPLDTELAAGRLFREGASLPKFSKGTIDRRRAKNLVPGTSLKPHADDDIVPVVIVQRSISSSAPISASSSFFSGGAPPSSVAILDAPTQDADAAMHGFTLLVPRGWGGPFFHSLSYPSPTPVKVIALQQARQQVLESGSATSFPHDWPHCGAHLSATTKSEPGTLFERWAGALGLAEWQDWARRPPAKRENWDAKGVRWPFGPVFDQRARVSDEERTGKALEVGESMWTVLSKNALRMAEGSRGADRTGTGMGADGLLTAILNASTGQHDSPTKKDSQHWLCCVRSLASIRPSSMNSSTARSLAFAYVPVRVQACRKGLFGQWSEIHLSPDVDEVAKWRAMLTVMESDRKRGERMADELGPWQPPEPTSVQRIAQPSSTYIGTVTSGDYALTQGRSFAVGVIPLVAWLELCAREAKVAATSKDSKPIRGRGQGEGKGEGGGEEDANMKRVTKEPKKRRNAIPKQALVFVKDRASELYRLASVEVLVP